MKVLLVNALYEPYGAGGAERSVQYLAEQLADLGHSVAVVTLSPDGDRTEYINGVRVHYVRLRNLFWWWDGRTRGDWQRYLWNVVDVVNLPLARKVGAILDREQPDVVHTNNLPGLSLLVWREVAARGLPLVHSVRDYFLLCATYTMYRDGDCVTPCVQCRPFAAASRGLSTASTWRSA